MRLGRSSLVGSISRAGRGAVVGRALSGLLTLPLVDGRASPRLGVLGVVVGRAAPDLSPTPVGDLVTGSTRPLGRFCSSITGTPFVVDVKRPLECAVVGVVLTKRV